MFTFNQLKDNKGGLGALTRLNADRGNEGRREGVSGGGRQTGRGG